MLFFELIQVALGQKESLTKNPSEQEWEAMFDMAKKQAVVGIAFHALNKLAEVGQKPPLPLLYEWIGLSEQIKARNYIVNSRCIEVTKLFADAGFRSCILKGQGNALMYPEPLLRTSGDIDIWVTGGSGKVNGSRKDIHDFVVTRCPNAQENLLHIDFPIFEDVPVEVHYKPRHVTIPKYDKRLQAWFDEKTDEQFSNVVRFDGCEMCVPTAEFNVILQLSHIMSHFFIEGVGLRHFLDFYYVLAKVKDERLKVKDERLKVKEIQETLQYLAMEKFARGVMWIEKECLNLPDEYFILEPDEKIGKIILNEMMEGGNFGQHDERYAQRKKGYLMRGLTDTYRLIKLAKYFPSESIWKIVRKVENQRWKVKNSSW